MTTELRVPDATCGHCKQTIESAVSAIDGVTAATFDLGSKRLSVHHADSLDAATVRSAVAEAGYTPQDAA